MQQQRPRSFEEEQPPEAFIGFEPEIDESDESFVGEAALEGYGWAAEFEAGDAWAEEEAEAARPAA